jgi:hypothetical protein
MSAHRLYCYAPHRQVVADFLKGLGAIITHDNPFPVDGADQLHGLDHITFVVVDHHPRRIPQRMWEAVIAGGAIVIHVDDQYVRECAPRRVHVRYYHGIPAGNDGRPV